MRKGVEREDRIGKPFLSKRKPKKGSMRSNEVKTKCSNSFHKRPKKPPKNSFEQIMKKIYEFGQVILRRMIESVSKDCHRNASWHTNLAGCILRRMDCTHLMFSYSFTTNIL